jgi:hypothetical protein
MESILDVSEKARVDVMAKWLAWALPEFVARENRDLHIPPKTQFENPLLFHVRLEFNALYDFILSPNLTLPAPVAETLVKYRALDAASTNVTLYPVILKDSLFEMIVNNETPDDDRGDRLAAICRQTGRLLLSANAFYKKTKEVLFSIKTKELQNGAFTEDSLAIKAAACPSSLLSSWRPGGHNL